MPCSNPDIPEYLHWNNRPVLDGFYEYHLLYRLKPKGNPIEIPNGNSNDLSCKWSKLIKRRDILRFNDPKLGDDYSFLFISKLRRYRKERELNDDIDYSGKHILTCFPIHAPNPCDYSHVGILIHHRIYSWENKLIFDEKYSYEQWSSKKALLRKRDGKFWKSLRSNYRLDMINLFKAGDNSSNDYRLNRIWVFIRSKFDIIPDNSA